MPSAATHLAASLNLLKDPALNARQRLTSAAEQGAFLFGSVSPDVRVVSGLTREETHFYNIPISSEMPAAQALLDTHPTLADVNQLPAPHAAFIAGYLTHLIMDETWLEVVVMPHIFIDQATWNSDHPNYRLYSLLMIHLAEESARHITPRTVKLIQACQPQNWLPFASDHNLTEWRDRVSIFIEENSAGSPPVCCPPDGHRTRRTVPGRHRRRNTAPRSTCADSAGDARRIPASHTRAMHHNSQCLPCPTHYLINPHILGGQHLESTRHRRRRLHRRGSRQHFVRCRAPGRRLRQHDTRASAIGARSSPICAR